MRIRTNKKFALAAINKGAVPCFHCGRRDRKEKMTAINRGERRFYIHKSCNNRIKTVYAPLFISSVRTHADDIEPIVFSSIGAIH